MNNTCTNIIVKNKISQLLSGYTENRSFSIGHIRWNWTPPQFFFHGFKKMLCRFQDFKTSFSNCNSLNSFNIFRIKQVYLSQNFIKNNIKNILIKLIKTYTVNRSFSIGHIRWNWTPPQFFIDCISSILIRFQAMKTGVLFFYSLSFSHYFSFTFKSIKHPITQRGPVLCCDVGFLMMLQK